MVREDVCKGCLAYNSTCVTPSSFNGEICPCSLCVIKMMCEATCEEFRLFRHEAASNL